LVDTPRLDWTLLCHSFLHCHFVRHQSLLTEQKNPTKLTTIVCLCCVTPCSFRSIFDDPSGTSSNRSGRGFGGGGGSGGGGGGGGPKRPIGGMKSTPMRCSCLLLLLLLALACFACFFFFLLVLVFGLRSSPVFICLLAWSSYSSNSGELLPEWVIPVGLPPWPGQGSVSGHWGSQQSQRVANPFIL